MLVDAHRFPAPALWQGLMLLVVVVWAIWVYSGLRSPKALGISLAIIAIIGILLVPFVYHVTRG